MLLDIKIKQNLFNCKKLKFFLINIFVLSFFILVNVNFGFSASNNNNNQINLNIINPSYFEENNYVYKTIHCLNDELLSVTFCVPSDIKNLSVYIENSNKQSEKFELNYYRFYPEKMKLGDSCYSFNYPISKIKYHFFNLVLDYTLYNKNMKVIRYFEKTKLSNVVNDVLLRNPEDLTLPELSYYLIVLNDVENIDSQKSMKLYDYLKNERDNTNKCWPAHDCKLDETSLILYNLKRAGYNLDTRLLNDGKTYLENKVLTIDKFPLHYVLKLHYNFNYTNYSSIYENFFNTSINNETLNSSNDSIIFNSTGFFQKGTNLSCDLYIDGKFYSNYFYTKDSGVNITVNAGNFKKSLKFNCSHDVNFTLEVTDPKFSVNFTKKVYNSSEIDYDSNISSACIGDDGCNFEDTLNVLLTYGTSFSNYTGLDSFVKNYVTKKDDNYYVDDEKDNFSALGKFLLYSKDQSLKDYLDFKQNNDGSWGYSDDNYTKVLETSNVILGLENFGNSEYVDDGKKWIYYNEPESGWKSVEKNTLAYLAIKEKIKPFLIINSINEIKNKTKIRLQNPTSYNLNNVKLTFSDNINNYLKYSQDLGNIYGGENFTLNVSLIKDFFGTYSGFLDIEGMTDKNEKIDLLNIPVTIVGKSFVSLVNNESFITSDDTSVLLNLNNYLSSKDKLDCNYINPFTGNKTDLELTNTIKSISLNDKNLKSGLIKFGLNCMYDKKNIYIPLDFYVNVSEKSFEVSPTKTLTNTNSFSIKVTNLLTKRQILSAEVFGTLANVIKPEDKSVLLSSNDRTELYFNVTNPTMLKALNGTSTSYILIKSDSGYSKKVSLVVNLKKEPKKMTLLGYILYGLGILFLLFILFIIVRVFQYFQYVKNAKNQEANINNNNNDDMIYIDDDF